jgi:hypothetical protein
MNIPTTVVLDDKHYRIYEVSRDEWCLYTKTLPLGVYETKASAIRAAEQHARSEEWQQ